MSKLIVKCMCGAELTASHEVVGTIMQCPHCHQRFLVPDTARSGPQRTVDLDSIDLGSIGDSKFHRPQTGRSHDRALRLAVTGSLAAIILMFVVAVGWVAVERIGGFLVDFRNGQQEPARATDGTGGDGNRSATAEAREDPPRDRLRPGAADPREDIVNDPFSDTAAAPFATAPMDMTRLIEMVEPSVVRIDVTTDEGTSIGSGFVVDEDGLVITNYHVVEGAVRVRLKSNDGHETSASGFVIAEPSRDICVIRVDPNAFPCRPLRFASGKPKKGAAVAAFGSPLGFSFSATNGIVSAYRSGEEIQQSLATPGGVDAYAMLGYTTEMEWVQTSAAISGGNSGGPLVNMRGEMVGVNTFKHEQGQNVNFAVALSTVQDVLDRRSDSTISFNQLPRPTGTASSSTASASAFGTESIDRSVKSQFVRYDEGPEIRRYTGHNKAIIDIAASTDGKYLAVASLDRTTTVFDMRDGRALYVIETSELPIRAVAFARGSEYLVTFRSAGSEPSIAFRNPQTGARTRNGIRRRVPKQASVLSVSPDGRSVYGSWIDGTQIVRRSDPYLSTHAHFIVRDEERILAAAFSNDGKRLMSGASQGELLLRELSGDELTLVSRQRDAHRGAINVIEASPNGDYFASGGDDAAVSVWRSFKRQNEWNYAKLLGDRSEVYDLSFSPDGELLAVARANGVVEIWDVSLRRRTHELDDHESSVGAVAFLAGGRHVVTGSSRGIVRIFGLD